MTTANAQEPAPTFAERIEDAEWTWKSHLWWCLWAAGKRPNADLYGTYSEWVRAEAMARGAAS